VELHKNGRLSLAETEFLAGATLPLKDGILRAVSCAGISLAEALRMATANPGRFVRGVGTLRPGAPANLIRFTIADNSGSLTIERVWVNGEEWSGA
jgi:N-acetylglucosamine-6-phosphate deacetylase